mmetsp:Transcript_13062/g.28356  ORF Transcript_13062/g.28356 Transcript_13062/m.28356 type:complete len:117 (+) Transcript_13062:781-1131(+)
MEPSTSGTTAAARCDLVFFEDLRRKHENDSEPDDDGVDNREGNPDADDDNLSTILVNSSPDPDDYDVLAPRQDDAEANIASDKPCKNEVNSVDAAAEIPCCGSGCCRANCHPNRGY